MNLMKLNKAKCKFLYLGLEAPQYQYRLEEEGIESTPAEKNLGVLVDETPSQELLQAQERPTQEKHGPATGRLEEGHGNNQKAGAHLHEDRLRELVLFSLEM